ncbi:oxidoreductase [Ideonella livida]|uniref:Oxidoreductase n=1 Tax=Ideonella livida TaxID=2707176 RepID=A0A7C9PGK1_9BURK|nr:oxidoreductase [Ideonella livida]NDY90850.1 oxidoreductase [Ideonella livida]
MVSSPLPLPDAGTALRVGLLGYGYAGRTFHAPLLRTTPGLALVAVASRQPAQVLTDLGPQVTVHAEPAALLARGDLDLVVVATPNDTHVPLAEAALRAGCAVVVDKPFALDARQAEPLLALARQQGKLLSVFHNRRWDGDFLTAQALLASGRLGTLRHARLHFDRYRPTVRARWREADVPGGGLFIDLMPHLLDQALQLFGTPQALSADIARLREGGLADDHASVQLRYANGLRVALGASMLSALPGPRFELQGTHGAWRSWPLDPQEDALKAGHRPDPAQPAAWGQTLEQGELLLAQHPDQPDRLTHQPWPTQAGRYPAYYAGIAAALRGQGPNPVPAQEALQVMQLLDLARQADQARRELPVDLRPT